MIVLIVWDGLRPDMITAEGTPFLLQKASEGIFCKASHAVFPTATRVNAASLSTGCYPRHHGIVGQELYVPAIDLRKPISCAAPDALQTMARLEGGRLLDPPTLGEILRAAGKKMACGGAGPPGATYLMNPTVTGPVVNWATAWPREIKGQIIERYGGFLGPESTSPERDQFVLRAVQDILVPEYCPDLLTVWIDELDHVQHAHDLGSPEAIATLTDLDLQLKCFLDALEQCYSVENVTCLFLSDHGFSTISERVDVDQALIQAGLKESPDSNDIIRASQGLYLTGKARERFNEVVCFLQSEPWVGGVFLRDDLVEACPTAMPQSATFSGHRRSPEITFAYQWSPAENDYGVPGCVVGPNRMAATHGSASPYAINNCLVAWGKGIKKGVISTAPCGIIDVAPTVLHLLGIKTPADMDGRVLNEILEGRPPPEALVVSHEAWKITYQAATGSRHQVAVYSNLDGFRYLDHVTVIA